VVHGFGHAITREVEQVVDGHLGLQQPQLDGAAELSRLPRRYAPVALFDAIPDGEEVGVGRRLDDLEVLGHESVPPLVARADRPDGPDFVRAAAHRFLDVGITNVDRVDVGVAADLHWGEPHRQRDGRNQVVFRHLIVGDDLEPLLGEVEEVEGAEALAVPDGGEVYTPERQDLLAESVIGEKR
jgi:hypothetical protein